jgi:hypothetical protein
MVRKVQKRQIHWSALWTNLVIEDFKQTALKTAFSHENAKSVRKVTDFMDRH